MPMSDPRFFDLALKAIAQQASGAERAELDALLAREPELRAEFELLRGDVRLAKDVLPLVGATQATAGEFPAYARGRLQTKVRETLGQPQSSAAPASNAPIQMIWRWRWLLGLATAAAVIIIVAIPVLRQTPEPVAQVATQTVAGGNRASNGKEPGVLQKNPDQALPHVVANAENPRAGETNWPSDRRKTTGESINDRHTSAPVVLVAMLDTAGASRGSEVKEVALLQQAWSKAVVNSFSSTENTRAWDCLLYTSDAADE